MEKIALMMRPGRPVSWIMALSMTARVLLSCAHHPPQLSVSQYSFTLDDESYRLRSIVSPMKSNSYNEIIGEKFVASDYDQDDVVDCVTMGDVPLVVVQQIYDYGLNCLSRENKLKVRAPDMHSYLHEQDNLQFEIRSFRPSRHRRSTNSEW